MALAKGRSRILVGDRKLTRHTETAIQIAEIMLGSRGLRFSPRDIVNGGNVEPYVLECEGCGLVNEKILSHSQ